MTVFHCGDLWKTLEKWCYRANCSAHWWEMPGQGD